MVKVRVLLSALHSYLVASHGSSSLVALLRIISGS
jgi:hypothetical protein